MLTLEIAGDDTIEVFFDLEGRDLLVRSLSRLQSPGGHDHLMTEARAGWELSGQAHSATNKLVHRVTPGIPSDAAQPAA